MKDVHVARLNLQQQRPLGRTLSTGLSTPEQGLSEAEQVAVPPVGGPDSEMLSAAQERQGALYDGVAHPRLPQLRAWRVDA
jgi:hypothetical protein